MITIKIPLQYAEEVLYKAGYSDHPKGISEFGYVREFAKGKRWHAKTGFKKMEIHLDYTFNGMHKVMHIKPMERVEFHRVRDIFYLLYPEFDKVKKQVIRGKFKSEYAPNLADIQKQISNLNTNV